MQDKYTILLVDDEENVVNALERLFKEEKSYEIITAISAKEALEKISQVPVDLVISDQRMPVMTGVELLKQIKEKYPDSIRILLSGYADTQALVAALNKGEIHKFITKPWDSEELQGLVKSALEQREEE